MFERSRHFLENNSDLHKDQQVQDIISRYRLERCDELSNDGHDGRDIRECMVLINRKPPQKRRYVERRQAADGQDHWQVFLASPSPPAECKGVQRKEEIYIEATLRMMQEQFHQNRCRVPDGCTKHGMCRRCGGDLICEMAHFPSTGFACRFVCFGNRTDACDYATVWGC